MRTHTDARIRQLPVARNAGQISRADPTTVLHDDVHVQHLATADWTVDTETYLPKDGESQHYDQTASALIANIYIRT